MLSVRRLATVQEHGARCFVRRADLGDKMEKVTDPGRTGATSQAHRSNLLAFMVGIVGPLLLIAATGYLTIQLELSEIGAPLFDLASRPVDAAAPWTAYLIRIALVVLSVVAFLVYRTACRPWASRLVVLVILVIASFLGSYTLRPLPSGGEPEPMIWLSFIYGATSPFILALVGAVLIDVISTRRAAVSSR